MGTKYDLGEMVYRDIGEVSNDECIKNYLCRRINILPRMGAGSYRRRLMHRVHSTSPRTGSTKSKKVKNRKKSRVKGNSCLPCLAPMPPKPEVASFEKGDKVRIKKGKYEGEEGTIKRRLESRGKWGVRLDDGTKTAVSSGNLDILQKEYQPHSVWMSPADRANCEYYQGLQDGENTHT